MTAVTWERTADRAAWRASLNGLLLTVTRLTGGDGWRAVVEGQGVTERSAPLPTRVRAQRWAENRAGAAS